MLFPLFAFVLSLLSAVSVHARSAEDYFHGGAWKYVSGKHQEALIEVEEGLRQYPDDAHLQKLADQLRKMKDQQNPSGGKGDNKDKNKDKKDPGKDQDKNKDPGKKDGDKKPEDKDNKDGKKPPEQPPEPKDGDGKKSEGKNPAGAPPPGQMSEDDAKRLLNSFVDDEKKEQRERQKLLRKRLQSDQDW